MGSSGSSKAEKQAQANEAERQRQIAASSDAINSAYDNPARTGQYGKLAADTTKYYTSDLNQQKAINDRKLKFSLARSGNFGGSLQVDQTRSLGQDYLKGLVEASRRGQAAGANLQSADEQSRMNLLAMAQSGLDATTAGSRAASTMQTNLQSGMADSTANALGDTFGNFANIYSKSEQKKAEQQGFKYAYDTIYKPLYGYGAGG